jgi:hypothetical protein
MNKRAPFSANSIKRYYFSQIYTQLLENGIARQDRCSTKFLDPVDNMLACILHDIAVSFMNLCIDQHAISFKRH